ncbi:LLM class flavin-dependent oxidoreductase [Nocardia salmonicida]|uniref:LLM class flavin-dependent oxidoreductase n=1 Tax=Nocardia salmonicida TaxID=53431 RepID=UPI00366E071E
MDFGILFEGQVAGRSPAAEREVLRSAVDQAVLADQLGFDRFYCVEHHALEGYSHSSAPEVLLSYVAAKTSRIRIAHGVIPLPFKINHPVRVAERTAMLDIMSNGRLDVGFGRSSSAREQQTFGVTDEESRLDLIDGMHAIVKMWTEDEMEYHSDRLEIPLRTIRPRPLQDPHPPLFMACTRDDTFEIAGRMGLGALSNAADGPEATRKKRKLYDAAISARKPGDLVGHFANDRLGATVFTCVSDDREESRRIGLRGMRFFMEASRYFFAGKGAFPNPDSWRDEDTLSALLEMFSASSKGSFSKMVADKQAAAQQGEQAVGLGVGLTEPGIDPEEVLNSRVSAMGTPSDTIDFVERMAEAGADECYFVVQPGGVPVDVAMETIRQIGEKVIPHFRKPTPAVL